jgi:hypothetical protein
MLSRQFLLAVVILGGLSPACSSSGGSPTGGVHADAGVPTSGGGTDAAPSEVGCTGTQLCGGQCCAATERCATDSSGNAFCGRACESSGECLGGSSCCDPGPTGGHGGVCMPETAEQTCLCTAASDCASNACAPSVDAAGNPTNTYVCVPNDGAPYEGCSGGLITCGNPYCCVTDTKGNHFCAIPCTGDSTCGSGHCDAFDFSASTCSGGTRACGG